MSGSSRSRLLHWDLSANTRGLVASIGFAGMFVGAAAAGRLADRYGRRAIFTLTILIYSITTLLSGVAWGLASLLAFRFIVGLGLGGELPVASTLVSEVAPARSRGKMLVILESFWAWGWIMAAVIGLLVVPCVGDAGWPPPAATKRRSRSSATWSQPPVSHPSS